MTDQPWRARILAKHREELDQWWAEMTEEEEALMDETDTDCATCPMCGCPGMER